MRALADVKQEWSHFRHDTPGERFRNHRDRMKRRSKKHSLVALCIGVVLLAAGVVLLFIPGPGLLLIVFGLALVASHSKRLSDLLDRAEPVVHRATHRTKQRWQVMPGRAKVGLIVGLALLATAVSLSMWKFVVSAYLLG